MKIPTLTLKGQTTEWAMTKKWQRRAEGGGWIGEEEEDEEGAATETWGAVIGQS